MQTWTVMVQELGQGQEWVPSEEEIVLKEQTEPKGLLWEQPFLLRDLGLGPELVLVPFAKEICEMGH